MSAWVFNDAAVDSDDLLYRRVLARPNMSTYDPLNRLWVVHPGAFRRDADQGASTHLDSILQARSRDVTTLYQAPNGSVRLRVAIPRQFGVGVLQVDDPEEQDPDLRAARAEIRPSQPEKNRQQWNSVANELARASSWVTYPAG